MRRTRAIRMLVAVLAASVACATGSRGGSAPVPATPNPSPDVAAGPPDATAADGAVAAGEPRAPKQTGPMQRRTSAAAEGAIMGTVLGAAAGRARRAAT